MSHQRSSRAVARALVSAVQDSPLTMLAAGIAYYAFVSLLPLLLLSLAVATAVGGESFALAVVDGLGGVLSPSGQDVVRGALVGPAGRGGATVAGLVVLLWSGLKLFRGLDMAFSMVYGTGSEKTFLGQLRNAVTALGAVGLAIAAIVAVGIAADVAGIRFVGLLGPVALVAVLTGAFLPLYYIFPDVPMTPRAALPGAVFAAVGWTVLGTAFRVYAASAGVSVYGVVGAVILLVTWFYVGGILLLLGAVLNGVLSDDLGSDTDRQLQQGPPQVPGQRLMTEGADGRDGDPTEDDRSGETSEADGAPSPAGSDQPDGAPSPADTEQSDGTESPAGGDRNRSADEKRRDRTEEELAELRAELDELEAQIDERTLHRDEVERDLKRYVRRRVRRGHATGWGPYLVLLYGTVMTLGAFYFLSGVWAIAAMLVIWLSTLGLYVVMAAVGLTVKGLGLPGRLLDRIRSFRD